MSDYLKFFRLFWVLMVGVLFLVGCSPDEETIPLVNNDNNNTVTNIEIQDEKLLACIKQELKLTGTTSPTSNQLYSLSSLDCSNKNLENVNIMEISKLQNIKVLNLNKNKITDLTPLTKLLKLEILYLSENGITDITPLSSITSLKSLGFYKNNISDLTPLKTLINLESLVISYNKVTEVTPLASLKNLITLDIHGNYELSDISTLQDTTGLQELQVWDTNILDVSSLSTLVNLTSISISNKCLYDNWNLPSSVNVYAIYEENEVDGCLKLEEATNNFNFTDTNFSSEDLSNLEIEGTSEDSNGNVGTLNKVTDVIASQEITTYDLEGIQKTEKEIIFRSFNIGEWKGKINETTTLLARIFMDSILMNLEEEEQINITKAILKSNNFKIALLNQKLYIQNKKVFEAIYIQSILELTKEANSYVSENLKQKLIQKQNKIFMKSNTDIDNIGGSIRLKYDNDTNTFNFRNYHNIYMGLRAYEKDKDYDFLNTLEDNMINPIGGGLIGTGLSKSIEYLNLDMLGSPANTAMKGKAFDSDLFETETKAKINQNKLYEIYKYQGIWDVSSHYNVMLVADIILGGISGWTDKLNKVKDKGSNFINKAIETTDTALSLIETATVLSEYSQSFFGADIDTSYRIENDIDNIRMYLEKVKPLLSNENRYDNFLNRAGSESILDNTIMKLLFNTDIYPESQKLKDALNTIKDTKVKAQIYLIALFFQKYYNEVLNNEKLDNYSYYTVNDMHYIAPLWLLLPRDEAKKVLKKYKYATSASVGSKGIPAYVKLFTTTKSTMPDFKTWIKNFIQETAKESLTNLEQIANFSDLIRNTNRNISNTDLFSAGTLKIMLSFLKDSNIISIDTNILVAKIVKSIIPGTAQAKAILGANEAVSWTVGTFTLPNKMYFRVVTDNQGNIELKYPPFAILGIMSDDIEEKKNWIGTKIYREETSNNFLVVTDSYYKPIYNVYFRAKDQSSIFENNSAFPNNTFITMNYNIRKSTTDTQSNFTDTLDNNNSNQNIKIQPETIADGGVLNFNMVKSGDYGYYFDLYDAWMAEQGTTFWIKNKTRGIYEEWIEAKFNYPMDTEIDNTINASSNKRYIYKVSDSKTIKENLVLGMIDDDTLKIQNNNDFDICLNVKYDQNNGNLILDDTYYYGNDDCILQHGSLNLNLKQFKDPVDNIYNDVEFIFYDKIANEYFDEEKYEHPRYYNWEEKSGGLKDIGYQVKLKDITKGEYFTLKSSNIVNYVSFDPDDNIVLTFDDNLAIDVNQGEYGTSSKNITSSIYFRNKDTQEKIDLYWGDWYFGSKNCKPSSNSRMEECETDYSTLKLNPKVDNNEYELVIENTLESVSGKRLSEEYVYGIDVLHPNAFEVYEKGLKDNGSSVDLNLRMFNKYETTRIDFNISTSSGKTSVSYLDIGSAIRGGPTEYGHRSCETYMWVSPNSSMYRAGVINYTNLTVTIGNSRNTSIKEDVSIEFCNENNECETKNISVTLDAITPEHVSYENCANKLNN